MVSNFNFKSFGHEPPGNFPLARQSSVYSLTFDEFQSTVGGNGKEYGSMNMDELLKSIWSAEENQNIGSTSVVGLGNGSAVQEGGGYLQKQGSLTLPRTISQKTVDEVWKDMSSKDKDSSLLAPVGFGVPLREPTLGEVTLEEFLVRAGVVREEPQPDNVGFLGDFLRPATNSDLGFGFQSQQNTNQINLQSANLPLNVNGVRSSMNQLGTQQQPIRPQQPSQQQQILPKQPALGYVAPIVVSNNQMGSPRINGGMVGLSDGPISNMVGLGANGVTLASDGLTKSNGDTSSVSPVPYVFNSGLRGRKGAVLEKVVERRQRRMIKNRESAARSRARKQAYTTELEAEVAKLKEENDELRKKQEEMMEMQKNQQVLEIMNQRNGAKRRCLRRTQTGIW